MTVTGRLPPRKSTENTRNDQFLAAHPGADMAREGRVAELRRLVADGQYRVDSGRLAIKILARALRDRAS